MRVKSLKSSFGDDFLPAFPGAGVTYIRIREDILDEAVRRVMRPDTPEGQISLRMAANGSVLWQYGYMPNAIREEFRRLAA